MEAIGSTAAILGVILGGWITRRTESLEGAAWGAHARNITTGITATAMLVAWVVGWWGEYPKVGQGAALVSVLGAGWFSIRLWVMPRHFDHWFGNSKRYWEKVWQMVDSGSEQELSALTRSVEKDIRRIVDWADDWDKERYKTLRWEFEEKTGKRQRRVAVKEKNKQETAIYAAWILDMMGDPRWAQEIVRQGGRLARMTIEEVERQKAWGVPVGKMLGSVTVEAVEQKRSFLVTESKWEPGSGSDLVMRERPTMRALWGQREAVGLINGDWINPGYVRCRKWGEEEVDRWMVVAEMALKTWAQGGPRSWNEWLVKRIAETLKCIGDEATRRAREKGEREAREAVYARTIRLDRLTKAATGWGEEDGTEWGSERQMMTFADAMAEEGVETVYDAATLENSKENWHAKHHAWMTLTWGGGLGRSGRSTELAQAICAKVWSESGEYLVQGWNRRAAMVVNMLLTLRVVRWGNEKPPRGRNKAERTERALIRALERRVKQSLGRLAGKDSEMAREMLGGAVSNIGNELVIEDLGPVWLGKEPHKPVRWKLKKLG